MTGFKLGFRRAPEPGPIPVEGEPRLVERIRAEITANGPITFARFMERALYEPDLGYYRVAAVRPGRAGDFLTAPEAHPIFGAVLARQLGEIWERLGEPERFVVREYGSGAGTLALSILRALAGRGPGGMASASPGLAAAIRYSPIEVNDLRRAESVERLSAEGFAASLALDLDPREPVTGVTIANELLDALPVHRVVQRDGELREALVGVAGDDFVEVVAPPSTPALAARLRDESIALDEGARAEICLAIEPWLADVSAGLRRGCAILVDYGYPADELYSPERATGTLMAYAGHRAHADPFIAVGRQDLTAHVDFTAVERAALAVGLDVIGMATQAEFLVGAGVEGTLDSIRSNPGTTMEDWLAVRSVLGRMLDPRAMGRFRVLFIGQGMGIAEGAGLNAASGPDGTAPPLIGLSFRLRQAGSR